MLSSKGIKQQNTAYYILMKMDTLINRRLEDLKNDKLHGASWLTLNAIETMVLTIEKSHAHNIICFIKELAAVANEIISARQSMISMANYVSLLLRQVQAVAQKYPNLSSLKNEVLTRGKLLLDKMEKNTLLAVENGTNIILEKDIIMTCSYSSLVCRTLVSARKKGKSFEVLSCDSTSGHISYGKLMRETLEQDNIKIRVINPNMIAKYMKKCSKALTGADTILSSGDIINGLPSLQLASTASIMEIPYFIICENAKFDMYQLRNSTSVEPGLDRIPSALWSGIISETGLTRHDTFKKHIENLRTIF